MSDDFLRDPITGDLPRRTQPTWFYVALWSLVAAIVLGLATRLVPACRQVSSAVQQDAPAPGGARPR